MPFKRIYTSIYSQTSIYRHVPDMANFGGISRVAVYLGWRYDEIGGISRVAVYGGALYRGVVYRGRYIEGRYIEGWYIEFSKYSFERQSSIPEQTILGIASP